MSTTPDSFSRGLIRAFERQRAKGTTRQQVTQIVQKADDSNDAIIMNDSKTSDVFSAITKLSDEQYRTAIIEAAVNHIRQKKEKAK
ncbi:hypothetical protein HX815_18830 [Pseudomonas sp. E6002]|uniref:hypothetical protein n=1 Tax=Pseudomonas sp. E6002 TaxID=2738820 RepID=UPI0015A16BAE|nr:hypothetical protein [Pseudomonas sp. E6002]NWB42372.1 hypothetical protein [Pseudomonas sp. E6002]